MCSGKAFLYKGRALIVLEEYEEAMRALETGLNFALQDPELISEVSRLRGIMGNRSARVAPGRAAEPDSRGAPAAKRRAQDDRIPMAAEEQAARQNTTGERDTAGVARMSGAEPTEREQRAVANYERHHQLTPGTVTLTQVKESAEGVSGWASRSVDAAGPAAAPPPVGSPAGGAPATLPEEEFTCPLCAKLLFEPVTTSCGAFPAHNRAKSNQLLTKKSRRDLCRAQLLPRLLAPRVGPHEPLPSVPHHSAHEVSPKPDSVPGFLLDFLTICLPCAQCSKPSHLHELAKRPVEALRRADCRKGKGGQRGHQVPADRPAALHHRLCPPGPGARPHMSRSSTLPGVTD